MKVIQNIKEIFNTPEIFDVYSDCMYMPTWEKFNLKAIDFMADATIHIFGYYENNQVVGVIVIQQLQSKTPEIKGIAVNPEYRKRGIGKRLIQHCCKTLSISELIAETDEDAVNFYRHCGFQTESFKKMGDNGEYIRYRCTLLVLVEK